MTLTAVIVEDQPLARARLIDLLERAGGIDVLEVAPNAAEGRVAIETHRPDLLFLDIQMPGGSGLELLRQGHPGCYVILTTAHAEHAIEAFELDVRDYLLKPFGLSRVTAAIERARDRMATLSDSHGEQEASVLERVFVSERGRIVPVLLAEVAHIEADGDYVRLWAGGRSHLHRRTLTKMASQLDPTRFVRIHRSHVVNLDHVRSVRRHDASRYLFDVDGRELLSARSRGAEIRQALGLTGTP